MTPLFVPAPKAAKLLSMSKAEFMGLVEAGSLPGPSRFERWDVEQLRAAMRGENFQADGEFEWGKK